MRSTGRAHSDGNSNMYELIVGTTMRSCRDGLNADTSMGRAP